MGSPSMFENLDAIIAAVGTNKVALTMDLALTEWDSAEQRDQFLTAITKREPADGV
jgi:hypothetical protein